VVIHDTLCSLALGELGRCEMGIGMVLVRYIVYDFTIPLDSQVALGDVGAGGRAGLACRYANTYIIESIIPFISRSFLSSVPMDFIFL
jgi:hypothetical protein